MPGRLAWLTEEGVTDRDDLAFVAVEVDANPLAVPLPEGVHVTVAPDTGFVNASVTSTVSGFGTAVPTVAA